MKDTFGEKIFYGINYALLSLLGLTCLIPLLHIIALSLSGSQAVLSGEVTIWPVGWSMESFSTLLKGTNVLGALKNNVIITVVGVALSMVFTIMAAYPLSRPYFYARRFFTLAIVFTMLFSGGLIPTFLVIKALGLVNTYFALWLLFLISTFNMLIMRTFFENIPDELIEASRIDGCGEWRLLMQIVLPLSMPVLATLTLFYGVNYWNMFMTVLIYINDTDHYNLTVLVQQMVQSQSIMQEISNMSPEDSMQLTPEGIKAAAIIVMVLPMLIVYPFLQKYFVKGVMIGAIKG
ncbi:carbohydrate ABC transporter permease [Paenibacillus psychroresistens]|uniref:Carbohydrate ABC transporter permease n=1 Tax=Paenibacillus psychroresistens TaxID=1778678 RepID=A0A6B8RRB5_9BACL|nr:carbohydrate ABC transporter permease [Paenibacillus psychroresistens]QGQ98397.1 carbohydrate ABC transporter permease [Paenibacillus psychroresistens]